MTCVSWHLIWRLWNPLRQHHIPHSTHSPFRLRMMELKSIRADRFSHKMRIGRGKLEPNPPDPIFLPLIHRLLHLFAEYISINRAFVNFKWPISIFLTPYAIYLGLLQSRKLFRIMIRPTETHWQMLLIQAGVSLLERSDRDRSINWFVWLCRIYERIFVREVGWGEEWSFV